MKADVYMTDMSPACDERYMETVMNAVEKLPWKDRIETVCRQKNNAVKRLCAGAGVLLLYALSEEGVTDFDMDYSEHGKPYLKNRGIMFNLSHSKNKVICAVLKGDGLIGADIEYIRENKETLFDRCFSEEEKTWADNRFGSLNNGDEAFTRLWTLKESYVKMKGTGLTEDFRTINLSEKEDFFYSDFFDGYFVSICTNVEIKVDFKPIILDKICFNRYK